MNEELSASQPTQKNNSEMEKAWKKGEERFEKLQENTNRVIQSNAQDDQVSQGEGDDDVGEEGEQYDDVDESSEPYTQQQTNLDQLAADGEVFQAVPYGQEIPTGE